MKRFLSLAVIVGFLAACASQNMTPAPSELSYKDQPAIGLAVSEIQIQNDYKAPMQAPNVEHLMAISPSKAAEIWAKDRLMAKGGQFIAKVSVREASVKDTALPTTTGWRGWFVTEPTNRYDATLSVMIEIARPDGYVEAYVSAKANESRTILEDASASDKDRLWYDLTKSLGDDINMELSKQIAANFGPILTDNNQPAMMAPPSAPAETPPATNAAPMPSM